MTTVIFCADPLAPRMPDPAFADEVEAARRAGFATALLSYERLVRERDAAGAVRRVAPAEPTTLALYRGWMLPSEHYAGLYDALASRGYQLIATPATYRTCHELPAAYPLIAGRTPATVWLPQAGGFELDCIMDALRPFGDAPLVLKDYVKSRKHEWLEACFIPSAADRDSVGRVVARFLELQGDDLQGGLVFRAYEPLRPIGVDPRSSMPLPNEHRAIVLDGEPLVVAPYWEVAASGAQPPLAAFAGVVQGVPSRFFTIDLAERADGAWTIIELGDAQVAGLLPSIDPDQFYRALAARLGRGMG
jgi:hypothetical protein